MPRKINQSRSRATRPFAHEDAHVSDINSAQTFQQAAAAAAAGDAPSRPDAQDTAGGTAEGRAIEIMNQLGAAGQNFVPNAQTDSEAAAILQNGQKQFSDDMQQTLEQTIQQDGGTSYIPDGP